MLQLDDEVIVPIGCSCINRFQLEYFFGPERCRGSLFQWTIATPRATCQVLEHAAAGTLTTAFAEPRQFELDAGHLRHRGLDGLYFWHEDGPAILDLADGSRFAAFQAKLRHLLDNTFGAGKPAWLLWSNVQPNLRRETRRTRLEWADFRLTRATRAALRAAAAPVFRDPRFVFVGRREDVDPDLWDAPDVVLLEVPRSDKFRGARNLYAQVFNRILEAGAKRAPRVGGMRRYG